MEANEYGFKKDRTISAALSRRPAGRGEARVDLQHDAEARRPVRASNMPSPSTSAKARALSNPEWHRTSSSWILAGMAMRRCGSTGDEMRTEFVCIPRPITRSERPDGGPLRYRVAHVASLWKPGERPSCRSRFSKAILAWDGDPNGTRTRVFAVKGRRPRPLDDGAARKRRAALGERLAQRVKQARRPPDAFRPRCRRSIRRA